jgi:hypothetical protein
MASMSPALLGHFSRQLGPIYDESFPLIGIADHDAAGHLADLMASGDRSVLNRLRIERELWLARQSALDNGDQLTADLIEAALWRIGQEQAEQGVRAALHLALSEALAKIAEHWRAANTRIEALWLALKGGGE